MPIRVSCTYKCQYAGHYVDLLLTPFCTVFFIQEIVLKKQKVQYKWVRMWGERMVKTIKTHKVIN